MKPLLVATMLLSPCSHAARVTDCGSTMTTSRTVQGQPARTVHRGAIPGIELLRVDSTPEPTGAACDIATGALLQGAQGFRTAAAKVGDDPMALALLSTMLLEEPGVAGKDIHAEAGAAAPGAASPEPPRIQGRHLVYWRPDKTLANQVRVTVHLDTLAVETALDTTLFEDAAAPADPFERARAELADDDVDRRLAGLARLDGLATPEADAALLEALLEDPHWRVRKEAARRIGQRGRPPAGAIDALQRSLLLDGRPEVRGQAATALGSIGDPRAGDALRTAASDDADPGVRALAEAALQRLGG